MSKTLKRKKKIRAVLRGKRKKALFLSPALKVLKLIPDESVDLIYIDPPFNTGKFQERLRIKTDADEDGDRTGFGGKRYKTEFLESFGFKDSFDNYHDFLIEHLAQAYRILKKTGSLFLHLDWNEVHYAKVWLDGIFGRKNFINEIIWAYDFGGRPKNKWPRKHDTILWYAKTHTKYTFNFDAIDRIPYMAPNLVGPKKAKQGKTPTDVWWHTIVPTNGKEKTGYATQKPLGILRRLILVHSNPGDVCLDFFAGSGTTGEACLENKRRVMLVDESKEAFKIIKRRMKNVGT